jgi:DNA-binding CsgD family transcriptional regulator
LQAIVKEMRLSPRQAAILDMILRSLGDKQIASILGIRPPTLRTYVSRMFARAGTGNRMELAMRVLALSHTLKDKPMSRQKE